MLVKICFTECTSIFLITGNNNKVSITESDFSLYDYSSRHQPSYLNNGTRSLSFSRRVRVGLKLIR